MKNLLFSIIMLLAAGTINNNEIFSKSAVLIDGNSGRVLYEKNANEILPNASTTKIMTCILALENGCGDDVVEISKYASTMPDVQLNIKEGEKYYLKDLLYSLMLESHNDTAVAIAEHVAGSCEKFSAMMNEKARELGCYNTHFVTPNGLDKMDDLGSHGTTAYDLALIMKYCIQNKEFLKITQMKSYSFTDIDKNRSFTVNNKNAFLDMYEGMISGKTGFTGKAGYCYVGACKNKERTYVIALLASGWPPSKTYKWKDAKKIFDYGINNYEFMSYNQMMCKMKNVKEIKIENGIEKSVDVKYDTESNDEGILISKTDNIKIVDDVVEKLDAPVEENSVIGYRKIYINNKLEHCTTIVANHEVKKIDALWCLKKVFVKFCLK